jgi:hypothetical protein
MSKFTMVLNGVLKSGGGWFALATKQVQEDGLQRSDIDDVVAQFMNIIKTAYREGTDGYITFGDAAINIQSFAALSFDIHEYQ